VNHRIRQILQVLRLPLTRFHVRLRAPLQLQGEVTAPGDTLSAEFQTFVYLGYWPVH
jgi:hypothetical protein